MKLRILYWLGLLLAGLMPQAEAQTWTVANAPSTNWLWMASSADGRFCYAGTTTGHIYSSTNYGVDWFVNSAPLASWGPIACTADGSTVFAGMASSDPNDFEDQVPGGIYMSTNYGATWAMISAPLNGWNYLKCSADGRVVIADGNTAFSSTAQSVCSSSDGGMTWITNNLENSLYGFACSADGSVMLAGGLPNFYASTNAGVDWYQPNGFNQAPFSTPHFTGVPACSADGHLWYAVSIDDSTAYFSATNGPFLCSTNYGLSWVTNSMFPTNCDTLSCSADGRVVVAICGENLNQIYYSTNYGHAWQASALNGPPITPMVSSDGNRVWLAEGYVTNGNLYYFNGFSQPGYVAPTINNTATGNNLNLSWGVPSTNLMLQVSSTLAGSAWTDVTNPPVLNLSNLQEQITLSMTNRAGFYRLAPQ